jgi:hypothetical protein
MVFQDPSFIYEPLVQGHSDERRKGCGGEEGRRERERERERRGRVNILQPYNHVR